MAVETKSRIVPVRITPTQEKAFRVQAEREGRRLSEWLRETAQREVKAAKEPRTA